MANLVQIQINGSDKSAPAFAIAAANAKKLSTEMRSLGSVFNQAGNLVGSFGNDALGNLVGGFAQSISSARQLITHLGQSRLALLGVAAAGAAAGAALASFIGGEIADKEEKNRKDKIAFLEIVNSATMETLELNNKEAAAQQKINNAINERAQKLIQMKNLSLQDFISGSNALNKLREAQRVSQVDQANADIAQRKKASDDVFMEAEKAIHDFGVQQNKDLSDKKIASLDEQIKKEQDYKEWKEKTAKADFDADQQRMDESLQGFRNLVATKTELWNNSLLNMRSASLNFAASAATAISDGIGNALANIATGAQSAADAFKQLGKQLLGMLVATAARLVINSILAVALQSAMTSASSGMAAIVAASWALPAALVSLASYGANSIPAAAGIASTVALAQGLALAGGIAHGGLEYVPQESTFLLQKGERVIQPRQNEQLQDMLDRGGSGGGGMTMVTINLDGRSILKYIGQASADGRLTINARAIS